MRKIITTFMLLLCAFCMASAANYLTFTAEEDGSTFGILNEKNNPDVHYSMDGGKTWIALEGGKMVTLVHKGDKALLKGNNPQGFTREGQYSTFKMTGKMAASGSVMSLIDGVGLSTEIPGEYCFFRLFEDCASLTQAPELPAKKLAKGCYDFMFSGCTSLTQAPALPATTITEWCYAEMFSGCTNLTQAPALPAKKTPKGCYCRMFAGCTSLSEIHVSFDKWGAFNSEYSEPTTGWVADVASTGTFICPKALPVEQGVDLIPKGWTVKNIIDGDTVEVLVKYNYLTFTAEEDGSTFGIVNNKNTPNVQYSLNGGVTWTALAEGDTVILAHKGDKALLRGDNPQGFSTDNWYQYSTFWMTGKVAASGSVMSLIDGIGLFTRIPEEFCFYRLFKDCASLTQAPELPATIMTNYCYWEMFFGCTSLRRSPALPATTLAHSCYSSMFAGCASLTETPELPATALADGCYAKMFKNCTSLTQAPALPVTTLAVGCYSNMFQGCTSLTQAPELPVTTLAIWCYSSMFSDCTSLTQAPALPATTLAGYCYDGMFSGCTSLTQAPELPATTLADICYAEMFKNCTSLTQAPALPATTLAEYCYSSMFAGCTSLTQAPALPATTLTESCYHDMFSNCTSLTKAPELPATTLAESCYNVMFENCTSLTKAPALPATTLTESCYAGMFADCTSLTKAPELPATTLAKLCYYYMFSGCTTLSQINVSFGGWPDDGYTSNWVKDVAPAGIFICPKDLPLEYGESRIPKGWTVKYR